MSITSGNWRGLPPSLPPRTDQRVDRSFANTIIKVNCFRSALIRTKVILTRTLKRIHIEINMSCLLFNKIISIKEITFEIQTEGTQSPDMFI